MGLPADGRDQATRDDQHAAEDHRRQRRELRLQLESLQPLPEPRAQILGSAARLARVQPGAGLAGLLLVLKLQKAVIPVGDLLGEPVLHRGLGLADELDPGRLDLLHVLGNDVDDRVLLRLALQLAGDPRALRPLQNGLAGRLMPRTNGR